MSRKFGKVLTSIWRDETFLAVSDQAKLTFVMLISQPDISPAGVLPITERRWKRFLDDGVGAVTEALDELNDAHLIVVDDDTAELIVRSFIRTDGRLENSKLRGTIDAAIEDIHSLRLAEIARAECDRGLAQKGNTSNREGLSRERGKGYPSGSGRATPQGEVIGSVPVPVPGAVPSSAIQEKQAAAAAAALELKAKKRFDDGAFNDLGAARRTVTRPDSEESTAVHGYLDNHPDATVDELCTAVLGMSELDLYRTRGAS